MSATIIECLSWVCLAGGSFFCLTGAISLLRLPDFFTRMHGAGIIDGLGMGLILLGLTIQSGFSLVTVKIVLVLMFMIVTGPTAVHALARAALHGGIDLIVDEKREKRVTDQSSPQSLPRENRGYALTHGHE